MQLDRLELAGFLHFTEPAVLDLRDLAPGLVAIVGANGEGKSRLLDGGPASLYGPGSAGGFPSREGTLAEYATSRSAYLDALWSLDGVGSYRARVSVDGQARSSEAVLEQIFADGTHRTLNDGKVTTFRQEVARIFPTQRQLLASAYAAQGRQGSFVGLDQKGRMGLFAELLDLKHLEALAETAKRCASVAEKAQVALVAERDALAKETQPESGAALQKRLDGLAREQTLLGETRRDLDRQIVRLDEDRVSFQDGAQQHVVARERLVVLDRLVAEKAADLAARDHDKSIAQVQARADEQAAGRQRDAALQDLAAKRRKAANEHVLVLSDLDERIATNRKILDDAATIREAVAQKHRVEQNLANARETETALQASLDDLRGQERLAVAALNEAHQLRVDLASARSRAETVSRVPCQGEGEYAACRFLTDATAAAALIPDMETEDARHNLLADGAAALQRSIDGTAERLVALRGSIGQAVAQLQASSRQAALEPNLTQAEATIAGYDEQKAQAKMRFIVRSVEFDEQEMRAEAAQTQVLAAIRGRLGARLGELEARQAAMQQALEGYAKARQAAQGDADRTQAASGRLAETERALAVARAVLAGTEMEAGRLGAERAETERLLESYQHRLADLAELRLRLQAVEDEWLAWRLLTQALGRDGLPRLEIDAAGPTIANLCNDLLASAYSTRFSVDITTQVPRADGKGMKEEFTLRIFDNAHGGVRDISDLSGGERVVVEEALRSAIALFVNSRGQQPIRTMWRDETTGALDPDNVPRYVAMLRRLQQLGGVRHVLFVTHSELAASLADTVIRVEAGVPSVERAA